MDLGELLSFPPLPWVLMPVSFLKKLCTSVLLSWKMLIRSHSQNRGGQNFFFLCKTTFWTHSCLGEQRPHKDIRNCSFVLSGYVWVILESLTLLLFFFPFRIFDFLTASPDMLC